MYQRIHVFLACTWRHHFLKYKTKEPPNLLSSSSTRGGKVISVRNFLAQYFASSGNQRILNFRVVEVRGIKLRTRMSKNLYLVIFSLFLVFMWRSHIPKLEIILPFEVLVSSDKRPCRNVTFDNVLARQSSSFCNRALQAFALRDMKMAARKDCRAGQKTSYRFSFC